MSLAYFIFLFLHRKDAMYAQSLLISVNKVNIIIGTFVFKLTILQQSTLVPFERQFKYNRQIIEMSEILSI